MYDEYIELEALREELEELLNEELVVLAAFQKLRYEKWKIISQYLKNNSRKIEND